MAFCNQDAGPPHRTGATGRLARSIKVVSLLVEAAPMHRGAIVNLPRRPINLHSEPIAGTFRYIEEGQSANGHQCPVV